jgi:DNA-binding SARP family transcriptional activator
MFGHDHVLHAKLIPPRPRRHTLVRPRLQERLAEALEVPLTIIQAGPGYGKTTALASFIAAQPFRTVWYAIGEADTGPLPFLLHLIHALRVENPLIGEKALTFLQESHGSNQSWHLAVEALINDMVFTSQPETLLVLDDFHAVDDVPPIASMVEHLVEHLPPRIHLVLATRRRPPLAGLPKWRARAEVLELGEPDLAFTPDEVKLLFRDEYGVDLTPVQADRLANQTEGWIIALQLIWQGLRKGSSLAEVSEGLPDRTEALFTYLAQEVLNRQKPFVHRFLLATSVLDRLYPAACDALVGEEGSARVLAALEENGLFIQPLGGGVYRYHQLFHQFLREQAQCDPEAWAGSHLLAARHFQAHGDGVEAAGHFLAAGRTGEAAQCIRQGAADLLEAGRVDTLSGLLERLPAEAYQQYPELLLRRGDAARLTSRFSEALACYRQAAEAYAAAGDRRGRCLALQGQGRIHLDTVNPAGADGALREALQLADALTETERAELMALAAENETNRGNPADAAHFASLSGGRFTVDEGLEVRAHLRTGRLAAALACLDRQEPRGSGGAGASRSHREGPLLLSLIMAMMGDAERARTAAEEGIRLGREKHSPFVESVGYMRLGHALHLNPLTPVDEVAAQYNQAIAITDRLGVVRGKAEPLAGLCGLYGRSARDWAAAERYGKEAANIARTANDQWFYGFSVLTLGSSAVLLGRGEADGYLRQAEDAFITSGDPHGLTLVRIWQAVRAYQAGDSAAFERAMDQALQTAQANGYSRLFTRRTLYGLPDPQALIPLLSEAQKRGIRSDYAAWLLGELGIPHPEQHPGYTLRLRALGNFQAWRGSVEITRKEWQREKARQLLQLLVTNRRRMLQKEQLVEMLWPGADADTATRDFKVALNALWGALEPNRAARSGSFYILRHGTAYGLNLASGLWLDVDEFEALVSRGLALSEKGQEDQAASALRRALDLYQGDYLQDLPYEDWCQDERERLQVLYLRAAEWLAQTALRQGDNEGCIHFCELILARDHCWEEAFRLLMQAYYRLGNRAMALRTYDKCAQNLQAELGVDPMPATVQLYDRIRHSSVPAS